jgi:hypothetical protein
MWESNDYNSYLISIQVHFLSSSMESFNSENLEVLIQLGGATVTWKPTPAVQDTLGGNLKGTIRVRIFWYSLLESQYYIGKLSTNLAHQVLISDQIQVISTRFVRPKGPRL